MGTAHQGRGACDVSNSQGTEGSVPANVPMDRNLKIFISYRHSEMSGTAWALYLGLREQFGAENVFFDNSTLHGGMQWLDEIKSHATAAGAFLALIGPNWMQSLTAHQQRGDVDWVAKEIDLALRSRPHVRVIPVLVDGAEAPDSSELPPSLRALPECQAERLHHNNLLDDVQRLGDRLNEIRKSQAPASTADIPGPERSSETDNGQQHGRDVQGPDPAILPVEDDHFQMLVDEASYLVVFLGAGANADDHDGPWRQGAMLPDDMDLANYLADKVRLKSDRPDLAEIAQYVSEVRGEANVFRWAREILAVDWEPGPVHRYLARLPKRLEELGLERRYQMIVTPKYDAALERAFREVGEPFDVAVYMAQRGTPDSGRFLHLPWGHVDPVPVVRPNDYTDFPFIADDGTLTRTVIVRINGSIDDLSAGYRWKGNYLITEDHYIDYLGGRSAEEVVPGQILAKLREASCLFLGYTVADWRLRVFLRWIWGDKLGGGMHWSVERDPDVLERRFWQRFGVSLYKCSLAEYVNALDEFLVRTLAMS
jgi:hypothetical protein